MPYATYERIKEQPECVVGDNLYRIKLLKIHTPIVEICNQLITYGKFTMHRTHSQLKSYQARRNIIKDA